MPRHRVHGFAVTLSRTMGRSSSTPGDPARILVVDDDAGLGALLVSVFEGAGWAAATVATARAAEECVGREAFDVALLDLNLPDATGLELLVALKALRPEMSAIVLTAAGSIEAAVEAMRRGADNFVAKPIDPPALIAIAEKGAEAAALRRRAVQWSRLGAAQRARVLGDSPAMLAALRLVERVAPRETTVLVLGPTGSGKGIVARTIHDLSPRADGPFVALNGAGLAREMLESELFGHERGAFTGAVQRKIGLMEAAAGGTLFLDEIGELDLAVQAKLLTALEERRFRRVGGIVDLAADVRIVAATHRDLRAAVDAGRFRDDLYHRLNVFPVVLPPLAEREADILPLAVHFLAQFGVEGDPARALSDEAAAMLLDYDWPGNVRELRNVMERAAILRPPGTPVQPEHLPPLAATPALGSTDGAGDGAADATADGSPRLDDAERTHLERFLREHKGSLRAAARALGISRGTLYRKLRKYGLDPAAE